MSRSKLRRYFRHGLFPQLAVFEAVARLGSVTRAAEDLHLAQPTVSLQLKKLASTLEVQLFEQRGRQLHLTAAGHALRETAGELMEALARGDDKLAPWRHAGTRFLRLAAEPEARQMAARLIARFCAGHPGVQVSLQLAERGELLSRFAKGVDDVYLFELEGAGLPIERRWSVVHSKGRELAASAALFFRDELLLDAGGEDANNAAAPLSGYGSPGRS